MADILGISFSDNEFYLGHSRWQEGQAHITSVQRISYPFKFRYDDLLEAQHIEQIAALIRQEKEAKQFEQASLSIVLPENYAFNKRVAAPLNSEPAILKEQAQWELGALLPGDIASYKIIKTDQTFQMNTYEEYLFVAIRRQILEALQKLAATAEVTLDRVMLEDVAIHQFLKSVGLQRDDKNQLVVKIEQSLIKCFLFNDGKFFHSSFERLFANGQDVARKTASLIKRHYNESVTLLDQLSGAGADKLQLLYWGAPVDDRLRVFLSENFKQEISELTAETADGTTPDVEIVGLLQS